jgi:hypothetical protein
MYMCRSGDVEVPSDGLPSPSANVAAVALPGTREQAQLRFTQTNMKDLVSVLSSSSITPYSLGIS